MQIELAIMIMYPPFLFESLSEYYFKVKINTNHHNPNVTIKVVMGVIVRSHNMLSIWLKNRCVLLPSSIDILKVYNRPKSNPKT